MLARIWWTFGVRILMIAVSPGDWQTTLEGVEDRGKPAKYFAKLGPLSQLVILQEKLVMPQRQLVG